MAEIKYSSVPVRNAGCQFSDMEKSLTKCSNMIDDCCHRLRAQLIFSGNVNIVNALNCVSKAAIREAAKMDSLENALQTIAEYYEAAEKRITASPAGVASGAAAAASGAAANNSNSGTDKRNWWDKFIDWLFHRNTDERRTHTRTEQELAADKEMQDQIARLTADPYYSKKHWAKATVAEREKILTDYMLAVQAILGVGFVVDAIDFTYSGPDSEGKINFGAYSHGDKQVHINRYILEKWSPSQSYRLMTTIVHELRHAYQHGAIDNPTDYVVSQETIDRWKQSFDTYKEEKAKGYDAYRNIEVEKDARSFAKQD